MLTKTNTPSLENFWMPFTANRQFKAAPRLLASASGMYYTDTDGNQVLDGTAGLWCCNAGHGRKRITEAVERQISTMDFAPTFQMGHNVAFDFAEKLAAIAPGGPDAKLDRVFFTNSGSESVDTALKIAIAYQRAIGQGTRTMVLGREKGYHGVGFGGISVGGLVNNRRVFPQIPADHLRHTLDIEKNAFSKGLPANGIELADDLERLVQLHGAEKIAAVIVEPMSGSAGVILPPKGYLERLRATADKHGILLIFDEVITGFGRLGTPFAVDYFGVVPDLVTTAKGLTNGAIPMGAVFAARKVYDGLMTGPENAIELFHGYTYSGHPVAAAAGLATLEVYAEEGLLTRGAELANHWQEALHSLKDVSNVIDIRNLGLVGAIELSSRKDAPGARAYDVFVDCFKKGLLIRVTGDVIALSPPLIVEKEQIDTIVSVIGDAIKRAA
ncbi:MULTISPECIES: aspartate aminotransferase family protein [Brucella/Ochrobactrum group]|uniref:Aminotransferase class-III n=1 Tax=Brucella anthropi (strain ATCC 49188 / DSM 6882 / CCUG 24695 / JCM 21032 / LMG 3331 / NBRC 15819 / NCTC 12168 / Alc 37) TaxID=439375 RepID=A6WYV5_BRUA4|nr:MULTISPECIES: aspartate aminotransferase family protein [Brucella/Ochrobactrum group]ABS14159.1 aminotransferase class-III [Brucella anthropi ATCC 49188]AIK44949.1 aminotransferase class-III family protein [Brucella anthropi]KAB2732895.1 aspartate aminotransferase family protein [Brucella anthropi]KAB2752417.1 aspartate aminotransferase family protein [Brucella anthropi]KAB2753268.1 aspartate aminotransferase family protein [Brucella anthropi]